MKNRFNTVVEKILLKSNWFSGRRVQPLVSKWKDEILKSDSLLMFPKAEDVLLEFGGLKIQPLTQIEGAYAVPFEINPSLVAFEGDRFEEFAELLETKLYPIGYNSNGNFFLGISDDGRVFEIMQNLLFAGENFDEALSNLILGVDSEFIA